MALIVSTPITGGFVVEGSYVRIRCIESVMKDDNGVFFAVADLAVFKDKATADADNGQQLQAPGVDRVKLLNVDISGNIHQQLYAKLKTDLTGTSITWTEEAEEA